MIECRWIPGTGDLTSVFAVREEVFVREQGFALELERDDKDMFSWHVLLLDDGEPAATARIYAEAPGVMHVGRICVVKQRRGEGLGDLLMRLLVDRAMNLNASEVRLGAQVRVKDFYSRYGFMPVGDEFYEEDVPHINMSATAETLGSLFSACSGCKGCGEGGGGCTIAPTN